MKQLLEMQSVTIGYANTQPVLQEVSLTVAKGEIVAIVGQSGSGKSTLLRAIIGALLAEGTFMRAHIFHKLRTNCANWIEHGAIVLKNHRKAYSAQCPPFSRR